MNSTAVQYAGALRHAGCTLSELRRTAGCLTGCAELWDALNADEEAENKVAFENNSWIEAFVKDPKGHWHGSSVVDDADDVLDACGGISGWIDWLNENYIKEDKA